MPTYSYQCEACKREFEKEQRISESAIRKCPSCGKLKLRRLITSGNFILKGGGWYADGYGSGKKSSASTGASSSSSTSSTSSDSKPTSGSGSPDSGTSSGSGGSSGTSSGSGNSSSAAAG